MPYGLSDQQIEKIQAVLAANPQIERAILYGSRAMGNYRSGSDIDLTLQGNQLSVALLLQINHQLDDLLLPWQIDLSIFDQIENTDLLDHISRVGLDFYLKEPLKQ